MISAHEWLAGEVSWWWPSVADHLWQATLFALVIVAASRTLKRGPARLRHSLWLLASAKFVVPAGLFVFLAQQAGIDLSWFSHTAPGSQLNTFLLHGITEPVAAIANSYELTVVATGEIRHNEIYCALALIWLAGSITFFVVWALRRRKFLRALRQGRSVAGERGREWRALEQAKDSLRWKTEVELVISSHKTEPAVCRVWKPVILLPAAIADHLDDDELAAIMLHELIHIQRRDNLIGNLQMTICALLWFHPLVWFISGKLFDERELACDEEVLKIRAAPEVYASSILKVVRFSLGSRVAGVTGAGSGSNLRRRIENIMSTNNIKRAATWHRLLAGTLAGLALVLMVFAGMYAQARNAKAAAKAPAVQETGVGSLDDNRDSSDPASQADRKRSKTKRIMPPPPPPDPTKLSPPAPPPPQPEAAIAPAAPTAPTASTPATPPSPPVAPTPPTKEKSKSKHKDKEKDDKDKVEKGKLIEAPPPVYPEEAKQQKIEGTVVVAIVIGDDGKVISAKAKSGPEALYAASEQAASKARFKPTMVNGKTAKVAGAMTYNFVLDKK